jgi:ABC-type transporter Mla subunit MlaD
MKRIAQAACILAWMAVALPAGTSVHRDPLTETETDQLREAAQDPPLKLKLFLQFARQRLESAEALRADPKAGPDRGQQIHDLLEDFGSLVDELSDNVDAYATRKEDLRKPLAGIIAATGDFAARLKDFKAAAAASPNESRAYSFALADAIDSVDAGLKNAEELLQEQQEQFKKKK